MLSLVLAAAAWRAPAWAGAQRCAAGARRGGSIRAAAQDPPRLETALDDGRLEVRTLGFYPFPAGPAAHGPLAFLFKDTHQAVSVGYASGGSERLFADFMTAGGQAHPVWWDERVKWHVLLGGSIRGEVRIRSSGARAAEGSKLERLRERLSAYSTDMNLYTNNCRVFACRAVREVERLNAEVDSAAPWPYEDGAEPAAGGADRGGAGAPFAPRELAAEARLYVGLLRAGALPALYPLGVLALCSQIV